VAEFSCSDAPRDEQLRVLVLGRYSPAKGMETILRAAAAAGARVDAYGSDETFEPYKRSLGALVHEVGADAGLHGPVARAEVPRLFASSHVLVNNMRAGAPDKVVYEAAASCVPVVASNPLFDDLVGDDMRFSRDDVDGLAACLRTLDRRRRPELRKHVAANHSVGHWADALLATVEHP
jgi:glycosyltransferase involved in cell wall biosynthesis